MRWQSERIAASVARLALELGDRLLRAVREGEVAERLLETRVLAGVAVGELGVVGLELPRDVAAPVGGARDVGGDVLDLLLAQLRLERRHAVPAAPNLPCDPLRRERGVVEARADIGIRARVGEGVAVAAAGVREDFRAGRALRRAPSSPPQPARTAAATSARTRADTAQPALRTTKSSKLTRTPPRSKLSTIRPAAPCGVRALAVAGGQRLAAVERQREHGRLRAAAARAAALDAAPTARAASTFAVPRRPNCPPLTLPIRATPSAPISSA